MDKMKKLLFAPFPERVEDGFQGLVGLAGIILAVGAMANDGVGALSLLGVAISSASLTPLASKYFGRGQNAEKSNAYLISFGIAVVLISLLALAISRFFVQ
ncbi:hypothetical protein [Roseovarius sp. M141]|uniref:hypothetical protein n=1 Tax=Roseovarius sp. M141 TaxID=2583806 RepID=UPI0020CFDBE4|nr:hypothetical protein [Roseovarius sp. M141]MCQ0092478.1 hypothetical protein [Roseovarius sp. M141]